MKRRDEKARSESPAAGNLALIHGPPLSDEPGLGALTLPGYLCEVTQRYAAREALVFHEDGRAIRWSYAELRERALEVARALLALGFGKDSRIGVMMTNRPEWLSSVFGASMAGCVAVPLSTFSTGPELDHLLRASAIGALLTEREIVGRDIAALIGDLEPGFRTGALERSLRFPQLRHLALVGPAPPGSAFEDWDAFRNRGAKIPAEIAEATSAQVLPSDAGAILFSSGSTDRPKGIIHCQRAIAIHLWRWRRMLALEGEVRAWTPNGFFWSANFASVLGATLSAGGTLVLQSHFEPEAALDLMARERVSYPSAWPHQWKRMAEAANWDRVDLGAVRFLDPAQPLASHPSIRLGGWREPIWSYGSSETFTVSTSFLPDTSREAVEGSHGFALGENTLEIVDPLTGRILSRGEHGEIAVKGPTLMLGYLGVPREECFDAEGYYRTGDAGWIDERDRLHFEGRLSTVIKTGGANVSALEVDAVLDSMPGVKVARCVGVPDELLGEQVVACIVRAEGAGVSAEDVRAFARQQLASYKVPRQVIFLAEHELELTGTAKIKPAELRALASKKLAGGTGENQVGRVRS